MSAPQAGSTAAAIDALALQVDRDTVLRARAGILAEAARLRKVLRENDLRNPVGLCGGDPVSADAQKAFNERIGLLLADCEQHIADLVVGGDKLADVARRYGLTEDDIAASFAKPR